MAQVQSEIRYLTPPSVDVKKKKYCRFKKSGIKYIDAEGFYLAHSRISSRIQDPYSRYT